ncbi:MAG: UDP-N-acetylmuramoyl-L-alanyl-D-glutamate--2,6-diaminopimelate ligase, partial [Verrucomicrobiota bacterium]
KKAVLPSGVTYIQVKDGRKTMAEIASTFFDHPSSKLRTLGVTGTNGKSTVACMIQEMLQRTGQPTGLIGTIKYCIGGREIPAHLTTPESIDLQAMISEMVQSGCRGVVMEVSSHGIQQHRVHAIEFNLGIFTNLSQDHLDYHASMEDYFETKSRLFRNLGDGAAVINLDDAWGRRLLDTDGLPAHRVTFGFHEKADVRACRVEGDASGSSFDVETPWGHARIRLNRPGRFNVSNTLAVIAACGTLEVGLDVMKAQLESMPPVPGRLESVPNRMGFTVLVDYAHTSDALHKVLSDLRELTEGRLIVLFGCGGERDRSKRPLMGEAAGAWADMLIVTSDNPRGEDPGAIIDDILPGIPSTCAYTIEIDRRKAIRQSIESARKGDVVVLAGKGHEEVQKLGHIMVPFSDREVAREILNET